MSKKTVATLSLAGCFGCHMSFLDMDLKLLDLFELVEIDNSPLNDKKNFTQKVDIGLIEGGACNDENVHKLKNFRKNCDILISLGECAIMGGLPALRNNIPLKECLEEAYINNESTTNTASLIPNDKEIPQILDRVYPLHKIVKIDYFIPGCPPSGETIWQSLKALVTGQPLNLDYGLIKYD